MKDLNKENWDYQFLLKPCTMDSNMIYNLRGPEAYGPLGWSAKEKKEKKEKAEEIINEMDKKWGNWFSNLEESILTDGFINPIIVHAGWVPRKERKRLPKKYQNDPSNIFACFELGGNRLYIAQKHNLDVPCLVNDFTGLVPEGFEPVYTLDEIRNCFNAPPTRIQVLGSGLVAMGKEIPWR